MTGSRLRSLMNSMMRCFNSCVELTRMWRSTERAALEKTLDEVKPGTVFGGEHKGEAAVRRAASQVLVSRETCAECDTAYPAATAIKIDGACTVPVSRSHRAPWR